MILALLLLPIFFILSDGQDPPIPPYIGNDGGLQKDGSYRGCYYEGIVYPHWHFSEFSCIFFICYYGWIIIGINHKCSKCFVYGDPHFKTFDSTYYRWQGICNYTLAQPYDCDIASSYCPHCAIYSDFTQSNWILGSRLHVTTYKVNPNSVVTIDHNNIPYSVVVNGNTIIVPSFPTSYIYNIILWRFRNCAYIVGNCYLIVVCRSWSYHYMYIYTNMYGSVGLCGYLTYNPSDDFLNRYTCNVDSLTPFALSWLTLQQKDDCCPPTENRIKLIPLNNQYYSVCATSAKEGFSTCNNPYGESYEDITSKVTDNCVEDISNDPEGEDFYLNGTYQFSFQFCEIANNETSKEEAEATVESHKAGPKAFK